MYKRNFLMTVLARCGVQSSGIFVVLWPACVVLSCYVCSPVTEGRLSTGCPSAEPAWSSQDLHGCGRHESGIRTVPLPGTLACAAPQEFGYGLLCLLGLNTHLYRFCGSLHGLDTF